MKQSENANSCIEKTKEKNSLGIEAIKNVINKNKELTFILLIMTGGALLETVKAQMAPPNICIYDQILGHTFPMNVPYVLPLSGDYGANLSVPNNGSSVFKLRKMVNGQYMPAAGTTAISGIQGDTLIVTREIQTGNNVITYFDVDCVGYEGGTIQAPLPVTRLSIGAEKLGDGTAKISWSTASESNNKEFIVQRSNDGVKWKNIEQVEGHGNSNEINNYSVIDETPSKGTNYYRVEQIDFDGNFKYSPIETVRIDQISSKISVYPNPATDFISIEASDIENVTVYTIEGRELNVPVVDGSVDMSNLQPGVYVIEVIQLGNQVTMHKVFKN